MRINRSFPIHWKAFAAIEYYIETTQPPSDLRVHHAPNEVNDGVEQASWRRAELLKNIKKLRLMSISFPTTKGLLSEHDHYSSRSPKERVMAFYDTLGETESTVLFVHNNRNMVQILMRLRSAAFEYSWSVIMKAL